MTDWYRVECEACDSIRGEGAERDHFVTTRYPWRWKMEIRRDSHNNTRHNGKAEAEVVEL